MNILALIPARSGSKGITHKNIMNFKNKPLLAWSIEQAKNSKYINRIIVSTDSEEYSKIANQYGAETPFLRPKEISGDLSTDKEFIIHAIKWLRDNENYRPDLIVQLRPTYPTRKVNIIDETIKIMIDEKKYDSLRTVIPFKKSPFKMYRIIKERLIPLHQSVDDKLEPYNLCRQSLPDTYLHNGYIDIIRTRSLILRNSITGYRIYPYVMNQDEYHDIDNLEDWETAEKLI